MTPYTDDQLFSLRAYFYESLWWGLLHHDVRALSRDYKCKTREQHEDFKIRLRKVEQSVNFIHRPILIGSIHDYLRKTVSTHGRRDMDYQFAFPKTKFMRISQDPRYFKNGMESSIGHGVFWTMVHLMPKIAKANDGHAVITSGSLDLDSQCLHMAIENVPPALYGSHTLPVVSLDASAEVIVRLDENGLSIAFKGVPKVMHLADVDF